MQFRNVVKKPQFGKHFGRKIQQHMNNGKYKNGNNTKQQQNKPLGISQRDKQTHN